MTLIVNDRKYRLEDISTSTELHILADTAEDGIAIYEALRVMQSYTYNGTLYADRMVSKIALSETADGEVKIVIRLRPMFAGEIVSRELEATKAELDSLKELVAPVLANANTENNADSLIRKLTAAFPDLVQSKEEVR